MRPMGCCGAGLDWVVWGGEIVPNYALTLLKATLNVSPTDTVIITRTQQPPRPPKGYPQWKTQGGALCQSLMVDKMVDVDVPLTMNLRGVNISKHKDQGCY